MLEPSPLCNALTSTQADSPLLFSLAPALMPPAFALAAVKAAYADDGEADQPEDTTELALPQRPSPDTSLQHITVLPGTCTALPRIADLKSGCTDGLLLLSATACVVARETGIVHPHTDMPHNDMPPPKRARA